MLDSQHSAIYSGSLAKKIDQIAIEEFSHAGFDLMTQAGERAFSILQGIQASSDSSESLKILILCGSGNNGGDGYVVARCAQEIGWSVTVIAAGEAKTPDASIAAKAYVESGGEIVSVATDDCEQALEATYDVIVDALIGVGLTSTLRSPIDELVRSVNQKTGFKVAIDVPSGVNADTGAVYTPAFQADLTLTFIVQKLGLLTGPALGLVGESLLLELDIEQEVINRIDRVATLLEAPTLPSRQIDSHKGSFGHCVIAGGEIGMLGAVLLSGKAALRCGSGKVTILSTRSHLDMPAYYSPELMSAEFHQRESGVEQDHPLMSAADVIAIGPGLGLNSWSEQLLAQALNAGKPLVVDADALTLLAQTKTKTPVDAILTPHPGEAARLLGCTSAEVQADRLRAAQEVARQYDGICVLKGAGTLIASPDGKVFLCDKGNPGMASAGMGDVLSGIIASLLGQGYSALDAARIGVWVHAKAADDWVENHAMQSLLASDIIEQLSLTLQQVQS